MLHHLLLPATPLQKSLVPLRSSSCIAQASAAWLHPGFAHVAYIFVLNLEAILGRDSAEYALWTVQPKVSNKQLEEYSVIATLPGVLTVRAFETLQNKIC